MASIFLGLIQPTRPWKFCRKMHFEAGQAEVSTSHCRGACIKS